MAGLYNQCSTCLGSETLWSILMFYVFVWCLRMTRKMKMCLKYQSLVFLTCPDGEQPTPVNIQNAGIPFSGRHPWMKFRAVKSACPAARHRRTPKPHDWRTGAVLECCALHDTGWTTRFWHKTNWVSQVRTDYQESICLMLSWRKTDGGQRGNHCAYSDML